jgi:hypothetical protein
MDMKDSGKLVENCSKYNLTDSAVAVVKEVGTSRCVIQSPTKP